MRDGDGVGREAPLEEVLRVVCEGLQWLGGGQAGAVQASKSAISQTRTRLGPESTHSTATRTDGGHARHGRRNVYSFSGLDPRDVLDFAGIDRTILVALRDGAAA